MMVTRPGATFSSRVAGSLLLAVGLPELIVEDEADYFNLAFALASDPARLGALREKLKRNSKAAPLFDAPAYTQALESLYAKMWERFCSDLPPAAIHAY